MWMWLATCVRRASATRDAGMSLWAFTVPILTQNCHLEYIMDGSKSLQ